MTDDEIEFYIGPPRDDQWHMLLLRGLEKCFRCRTHPPVCLLITAERHQALCAECFDDEERESYVELVERVAEWDHQHGKEE